MVNKVEQTLRFGEADRLGSLCNAMHVGQGLYILESADYSACTNPKGPDLQTQTNQSQTISQKKEDSTSITNPRLSVAVLLSHKSEFSNLCKEEEDVLIYNKPSSQMPTEIDLGAFLLRAPSPNN
ncbi:hypothetical protein LguiA_027113 [Lonicera macranthoides]